MQFVGRYLATLLMNRYQITFETWDKVAALYQEKFMDLDLYDDTYDIFCGLFKMKQPDILEVGCGPGNITRYLISKRPGFKIIATDVSVNMINLAKQNNPTVDFKVLDCRQIESITTKFDGIVCGFCLPYLSKEDCVKFFKDSFHLLKSGGFLYFSAIEGDYSQSKYETGSTGDKCFVYYYSESDFKNELDKLGFRFVYSIKKGFPKNDESKQTHLILIVQKN